MEWCLWAPQLTTSDLYSVNYNTLYFKNFEISAMPRIVLDELINQVRKIGISSSLSTSLINMMENII